MDKAGVSAVAEIVSAIHRWANEHGGEYPRVWPMTRDQRRAFCALRNAAREREDRVEDEDCTMIVGVPILVVP